MDIANIAKIKRLVIIALFSDDTLMEMLVLKGGNALDLVHKISPRGSLDFDFSIEEDIPDKDFEGISKKIQSKLIETFRADDLVAFDISIFKKPKMPTVNMPAFWGGYLVEFKVIGIDEFDNFHNNIDTLRRNAIEIGPRHERKIRIEISKYEYCKAKMESDFEGYTIYVYTPEMIAFEKLRAICQQMEEYNRIIPNSSRSARARDFFDIHAIFINFKINLEDENKFALLKYIFNAKKVPLTLIKQVANYREFHRHDFSAVRDTLKPGVQIESFDYYFDFVLKLCEKLQTFWEI